MGRFAVCELPAFGNVFTVAPALSLFSTSILLPLEKMSYTSSILLFPKMLVRAEMGVNASLTDAVLPCMVRTISGVLLRVLRDPWRGLHAVHDRGRDSGAAGEPPLLHREDDVHASQLLRQRPQAGTSYPTEYLNMSSPPLAVAPF